MEETNAVRAHTVLAFQWNYWSIASKTKYKYWKRGRKKKRNKQNDKWRIEVRCANKVQISKIWEHHYHSCAVPVVCRAVISHASISVGDCALVAGSNIYTQKEQITLSWLTCLIYIASSSLESSFESLPPATDLRPHFFPKGNGSGFWCTKNKSLV